MSGAQAPGYLARLVTRMVDEPAIRPRVASRFELGSGRRDIEPEAAAEEASTATFDAPPAGHPAPESRPTRTAPAVDHDLAGLSPPGLAAIVRRLTDDNEMARPDPVTSASPGPRAAPPPGRPGDGRSPVLPDPAAATVANPRRAPVAAVTRPATAITRTDSAPAAARRARVAAASVAATGRAERPERPAPDVVQVHIGRVEVRAVGASPAGPAPVVRRSDAPRPLALDRYLAGERRS